MFCLEADIEADVNIIHEWIKNRILKRQLGFGCPRSGLWWLIRGFTRFAGLPTPIHRISQLCWRSSGYA